MTLYRQTISIMSIRLVKLRVAPKVDKAVAVAVINNKRFGKLIAGAVTLGITFPLMAAILPADRFDALVHSYDGGGMDINGPSLMLRKMLGTSTSVSANYYVDSISSASIDVITSASPYKEERKEHSVGVDYLHDKSIWSFNYTSSEENDYKAKTYSIGASQDFFGDLTTLSMGYSRGKDDVMKAFDSGFGTESINRHNFRLGLSQILSKHLIAGLNYELITDKGYLNNPYRSARFDIGTTVEKYPNTRSSNAVSTQLKYYLPFRAAISGEYRYFSDTWAIRASDISLGYTHPIHNDWIVDLRYRTYSQNAASFYKDIFPGTAPVAESEMLRARDKELSTYTNQTLGFSVSYALEKHGWKLIDKGSINFAFDHMMFDYQDFRDASAKGYLQGQEPLYSFSSNVMQVYLSVWY